MKFLINAISGILLLAPVESRAGAGDFDLEKIQTMHGRTYHDILILGADSHGLTFRHREGIAKIDFPSLSESVRMLYEVTDEVPDAGTDGSGQAAPAVNPADSSSPKAGGPVLTVYHRLTLYTPVYHGSTRYPCHGAIYWPSSWPRYHPAHQLTIPCYRECAVRDFLFLSGLSGGTCQSLNSTYFAQGALAPSHAGF